MLLGPAEPRCGEASGRSAPCRRMQEQISADVELARQRRNDSLPSEEAAAGAATRTACSEDLFQSSVVLAIILAAATLVELSASLLERVAIASWTHPIVLFSHVVALSMLVAGFVYDRCAAANPIAPPARRLTQPYAAAQRRKLPPVLAAHAGRCSGAKHPGLPRSQLPDPGVHRLPPVVLG